MRTILTALIACMFLLSLGSCKKCQTCVAKDEDGTARYTYPEICGTKKDLDAYRERCETEYGAYDFSCSCTEK